VRGTGCLASGYSAWCEREVSPHQHADAQLRDEIERVFVENHRTYDSHLKDFESATTVAENEEVIR
jgi:hypothetical protein